MNTKHISREYTTKLLEMIEEGILDRDQVIMACVKYMSEDEVKDMMESNEMVPEEEDPFEGFDEDTYDVEAMRIDHGNGNFDPEDDDPSEYEKENIVKASLQNGQFVQAREQCEAYGLDYNDYRAELAEE